MIEHSKPVFEILQMSTEIDIKEINQQISEADAQEEADIARLTIIGEELMLQLESSEKRIKETVSQQGATEDRESVKL